MIFFTGDHHFGHANIIRYSNRPYADAREMNDAMADAWNARVGSNDVVYYLGDFAIARTETIQHCRHALRGTVHLVRGNHDRKMPEHVLGTFASVEYYRELRLPSQLVVLCHYPMLTWNGAHRGSWMLHGHSHGSLRPSPARRLDVGVDARPQRDYAPWSLDEVAEHMAGKVFERVDGHEERR